MAKLFVAARSLIAPTAILPVVARAANVLGQRVGVACGR
jgi:hypothetical protein